MTPTVLHPMAGRFLAQLGRQAHRVTAPRAAVARAIAQHDGPFTAEGLCAQLPRVGRATIYRSVKLLVEMGYLCRVLLEDGALRYQVSSRRHHHHLICTACGRSQEIVGCDVEGLLAPKAAERRFTMDAHWLEVYGRCGSCSRRGRAQ